EVPASRDWITVGSKPEEESDVDMGAAPHGDETGSLSPWRNSAARGEVGNALHLVDATRLSFRDRGGTVPLADVEINHAVVPCLPPAPGVAACRRPGPPRARPAAAVAGPRAGRVTPAGPVVHRRLPFRGAGPSGHLGPQTERAPRIPG